MMPANDATTSGFAGAQLACTDQLVDRLSGHTKHCGGLVDAVGKALSLRLARLVYSGPDHHTGSTALLP